MIKTMLGRGSGSLPQDCLAIPEAASKKNTPNTRPDQAEEFKRMGLSIGDGQIGK
jgi:hypothetical protein